MAKDRQVVFIKGKGEVTLTSADFISQGGEGQVFARGGLAYKVYHDPAKMIPTAKIQELSALDDPLILRPLDILMDKKDKPIGYTMRFIPDRVPIARLFTKTYKQKAGLTPDNIWDIVRRMALRLDFIHGKGILVVDYNEMNFASLPDHSDTCNFDVDSYQTRSYRATALMESVRDRHMKPNQFTTLTDWFSFGVVSFQLFIGIHPYKGKHPTINYNDRMEAGVVVESGAVRTMNERMQRNISVMNKEVGVPPVCYPTSVIPTAWREWYEAMFEKGERCPPPLGLKTTVAVAVVSKALSAGEKVEIVERFTADGNIIDVYYQFGAEVIVTDKVTYLNRASVALAPTNRLVGFTPKYNHAILAWIDAGKLRLYDLTDRTDLKMDLEAHSILTCGGRLYAVVHGSVMELQFAEMGKQTLVGTRLASTILPNSAQTFDGVIIQNLLGSFYATILPEANAAYQVALPELAAYQIIEAKYENHVLVVVGNQAGRYDRLIFRIGNDFKTHDCRVVKDVDMGEPNFTVLDNGMCAMINDEDELEVFHHKVGASAITRVSDPAVNGDIRLAHDVGTALAIKGSKFYTITMRKKT